MVLNLVTVKKVGQDVNLLDVCWHKMDCEQGQKGSCILLRFSQDCLKNLESSERVIENSNATGEKDNDADSSMFLFVSESLLDTLLSVKST